MDDAEERAIDRDERRYSEERGMKDDVKIAQCRDCNADLVWCTTVNGRKIPMDYAPVADGNMVIESSGLARAATDEDRRLHRPLHKSHFATCTNAAKFRRPR